MQGSLCDENPMEDNFEDNFEDNGSHYVKLLAVQVRKIPSTWAERWTGSFVLQLSKDNYDPHAEGRLWQQCERPCISLEALSNGLNQIYSIQFRSIQHIKLRLHLASAKSCGFARAKLECFVLGPAGHRRLSQVSKRTNGWGRPWSDAVFRIHREQLQNDIPRI